MKFPLQERPFDLLELSIDQLERLEDVAERVVQANLNEFHDFVHVHNRALPKNRYKPVKKHDKVTIYKEITHRDERVFGPLGRPLANGAALLPKLVATGTVRGRMDDMMLGTAVRDAMAVVVKTSYVDDEIVDCAVQEIDGASEEDPFHYLVLKWVAKAHPGVINTVAAPRDMLVIQSSGFLANEGIGYHMLHSVDDIVPEIGPFQDKYGILRARISTMFMFRQLTPDTIEVYTVNYVEPNGSAPEAVTIMSTAASMGGVWKSLDCAYNMKLSWILKNKETYMGTHNAPLSVNRDDKCELCHKKSTLTGSMGDCGLCDARVCSRCRVTKKLSKANRRLELVVEKHDFCKTCLYRAANEDAYRIAMEMNVGVPITPWREGNDLRSRKLSRASSNQSGSSHGSHRSYGLQRSNSQRSVKRSDNRSFMSNSSQELDPDYNSFEFTNLVNPSASKPSIAHTSVTDLDSDGEASWSIPSSSVSSVQQPLSSSSAQELARKKRELEEQYRRQLQQLEETHQQKDSKILSLRDLRPTTAPSPISEKKNLSQPPTVPTADFHTMYEQMKVLQVAAEKTMMIAQENERRQNLSWRGLD